MKKVILVALIALMGLSASAQLRTSRTYIKRKTSVWYVRTGLALSTPFGMDEYDAEDWTASAKAGFDLDFGFNKPIGRKGTYWGMDLGVLTRGMNATYTQTYSTRDDVEVIEDKGSINAWALKFTPFALGYKFNVTENVKVDLHGGLFVLGNLSEHVSLADDARSNSFSNFYYETDFDCGLQLGAGVWFNKFNFDLSYQLGTVPAVYEPSTNLGALLVRLGLAF